MCGRVDENARFGAIVLVVSNTFATSKCRFAECCVDGFVWLDTKDVTRPRTVRSSKIKGFFVSATCRTVMTAGEYNETEIDERFVCKKTRKRGKREKIRQDICDIGDVSSTNFTIIPWRGDNHGGMFRDRDYKREIKPRCINVR